MFKTASKTHLAFLFALSLLTACGTASPFPDYSSSNGPVQVTLLDDEDKPVSNQTVSFRVGPYRSSGRDVSGSFQKATTDTQGRFSSPCALSCQLEVEATGFDSYSGSYSDPPRLRLARQAPEQQSQASESEKILDTWIYARSNFKSLGTLAGTDYTAFEVRTEAELAALKQRLSALSVDSEPGEFKPEQLSLPAGRRLLVFSANKSRSPYGPELVNFWQAEGHYYFTDRKSQLLTTLAPLASQQEYHSSDNIQNRTKIRLAVISLPNDGRKLIFHTREGRFELAPMTAAK